MSDELVERVARAIGRIKFGGSGIGPVSGRNYGEDPTEDEYIIADAAIAAVRAWDAETGPSEAEIQASFHERGTFFRGEVRGILRAAAVERARGEVG